MNLSEFTAALAAANIRPSTRTAKACRMVLVDGATAYAASQQVGISRAAVSRALAKLARPVCPTCGQVVRT